MKIRIAVVQMAIKRWDIPANLKKAEGFVKKAAAKGAHTVIFPEDFLAGPIGLCPELADSNGRYRGFFRALAKKHKIDIVAGSIIEQRKGHRYNTSCYIDRSGAVRGEYSKVHLWHPEKRYLKPGSGAVVFNTRIGRVGLAICWDLIYPELFRDMFRKKAEIVIVPTLWSYEDAGPGLKIDRNAEIKAVDALCTARAYENECVMVFCNAAGVLIKGANPTTLIGRSQVCMPFKGAFRKLNHNKEAMLIADVDKEMLNVAEKAYLIKADAKKKGYC